VDATTDNRFTLYFWATGTGKTTGMLAEIFAAMKKKIDHVYAVVIRTDSALQLLKEAQEHSRAGGHINHLMNSIFLGDQEGSCAFRVTGAYKWKSTPTTRENPDPVVKCVDITEPHLSEFLQ
jgi:hypothetical protein